MKKISNILLILTVILLCLWQLPWLYKFVTPQKDKSPFVLYSCIINNFTTSVYSGSGMCHQDLDGNIYTQSELDSIHPFFYARQLLKDERFPDTINGMHITFKDTQNESFYYRINPKDINAPCIGVYQLMESMSSRVKLESPDDVFRFTDNSIEFIDAESNTINIEKSKRFSEMLSGNGFSFPANYLSGNPSVKKDYDEDYLVLDRNNQLFHLKQTIGRPYVRKIDIPQGISLKNVFITEFKNRKILGFASDSENNFYVIENKTYKFRNVGIPEFIPEKNMMMIYGNMIDWTIKISSPDKVVYYAVNAEDYSLIKIYEESQTEYIGKGFLGFLSSISLRFTHPLDKFVYPRFGI